MVVFGVKGFTDKRVESFAAETYYVGLGELGKLAELLKQEKIKQVLIAGAVPKKQLYDPLFKPDSTAKTFLHSTRNKGDDHLLRAFQIFLKVRCGISVVDTRVFLKDSLPSAGVLTKRRPTETEWRDLKMGFRVAKHIGKMDIGQTVVIKEGVILALEAIEGTDEAIRRGAALGGGEVVVVKTSKPNQDLRFDLPCVGPETLETLLSASSRVLGVEAGKTIFLFRDQLIETADRHKMTLVAF